MKKPSRRSAKHDGILEHIRNLIVSGELRPGEQVPVRISIEQQFQASSVTVQRVFDRLSKEGFVSIRGPEGTFVASHPPHLNRYAVVFPGPRKIWNRYMHAISLVTHWFESSTSMSFPQYFEVDDLIDSEGRVERFQRKYAKKN